MKTSVWIKRPKSYYQKKKTLPKYMKHWASKETLQVVEWKKAQSIPEKAKISKELNWSKFSITGEDTTPNQSKTKMQTYLNHSDKRAKLPISSPFAFKDVPLVHLDSPNRGINIQLNSSKENQSFSADLPAQDPFLSHLKEIEELYKAVKEGWGTQATWEFDLKMKLHKFQVTLNVQFSAQPI